ncbi:hypothetical protein HYQ46_010176 [Verticillium longisporum]|nr:hypothetical protein HYQ46_010176 [Verticillium longisporum]
MPRCCSRAFNQVGQGKQGGWSTDRNVDLLLIIKTIRGVCPRWMQHKARQGTTGRPLRLRCNESTSAVFVFQQIGGNRQHRRSCQACGPVGGQGPWTVAQFL